MNDAALLACSLSTWRGARDCCRWCDEVLPKRRRRWCSDECATAMVSNHVWGIVRWAALKRDGHACVRCGRREGTVDDLGHPRRLILEVHHRDERADGRHAQAGCHHHLDGVETLCRVLYGRADKGCHALEHGARPVLGHQLVLDEAPVYE